MTPQALWAALSAPQRNRLSRYECKGCQRTLRRTLTDGCDCDVIGNVSDCLAASPHAHIKEVPPGGPFTSPARPTPPASTDAGAFIPPSCCLDAWPDYPAPQDTSPPLGHATVANGGGVFHSQVAG